MTFCSFVRILRVFDFIKVDYFGELDNSFLAVKGFEVTI